MRHSTEPTGASRDCRSAVLFDENTPARDWREQVLDGRDQGHPIDREIAFALAIADLLQLTDDLPLMPAVTVAVSV
jgi:hypothetical protein